MALIYADGFEQYNDRARLIESLWSSNSTLMGVIVTGRQGGNSRGIQFQLNGGDCSIRIPGGAKTTFGVGFAYQYPNGAPGTRDIISFLDQNLVEHLVLRNENGEVALDRGATEIDVSTGLGLTQGVWYYFEFKATIDDTVGAYEFRVDGQTVFSGTNVDTRNGGLASVNQLLFEGAGTQDPIVDDFVIWDTTGGAPNNDFLGDVIVETIFPDADGATTDWTPSAGTNNSAMVDDGYTPDDDSTYVSSSTDEHTDLYGFAALTTVNIGSIYGVDVHIHARKEDAGFRTVAPLARNNVTTVEGSEHPLGVSVDYQFIRHMFETDPDGGGAWTEADVNSAQFGVRIKQ